MIYRIIKILLLLHHLWNTSNAITFKEFVTLTHSEKLALDQFRSKINGSVPPEYDYMKEDVYLVRILRENDFNVPASIKDMADGIRWRKDNKIDDLLKENFADLDQEIKGTFEGCDREGRPVLVLHLGEIDPRRIILRGDEDRFLRYVRRIFVEAELVMRSMIEDGQDVIQLDVLIDFNGFSLATYACPRCLPVILRILFDFVTHFPGYINKAYVINTPSYALPLIEMAKRVLTPKYRKIVYLYGMNKKEWQKALFKDIDPSNNLSVEFGGGKTEVIDTTEFRWSGKVYRCNMTVDDL